MIRVTYRLYVDAADGESAEALTRVVEDALEALAVPGRAVEYHQIGVAEIRPLPAAPRDCGCGAADRWSCVCQPVTAPEGLPQGVYRSGADL